MFRLSKWYMDCVAPDGTAVVAYWSRVVWGMVRFRHAALLLRRDGAVSEAATLHAGSEPLPRPDGVVCRNDALAIQGHWQALSLPVERTLLATDQGSVAWHCLVPRAQARLELTNAITVEGLGYVERLDISLPPWHLPIEELCWGRFLSQNSNLVWIEWRGLRPLKIVNLNGVDLDGGDIANERVAWRGGRLELEPAFVLREGTLGTTALERQPMLRFLAPRAAKEIHECKWLRPARLVGDQDRMETGWAINEVVRLAGRRS